MSEQPEELDFEERRKRLEQLFAAEPHLSPTMRARQLYDEPETQSNGHHAIANDNSAIGLNGNPAASSVPAEASLQSVVNASTDPDSPRPDGMMSIAAARLELRQRSSPSGAAELASGERETDGLDTFRDNVLARWRRDIYSDR